MDNDASSPVVSRCEFLGSMAQAAGASGGAICSRNGSEATVQSCRFASNSASAGGAIYEDASASMVTHCTFVGNTATEAQPGGGAIHALDSPARIGNSIFWDNTAAGSVSSITSSGVALPTVTFSDVQGGCTVAGGCTTSEVGNLDVDPGFVDQLSDQRLQPTSPCVDVGDETQAYLFDLDGNDRIDIPGLGNDGTNYADLGAYEYQP
jgi:predicted outer membrane repeat protein